MQSVISVGIAGFGMSAKTFHCPFLHLDPRFQIKKVFERQTTNALHDYPYVEVVHQFAQLLTQEIDLVIITTPNQTHYALAKQAILAGKHVIVEKPLTIYPEHALELAQLAEQQQVILSVYQNRRWDNGALTVKKLVDTALLGDIVTYEIRFDRFSPHKNPKAWKETGEIGTGLVYDLGVHLIDHVVDLFGLPQALYADVLKQNPQSGSDDAFRITFYYENKTVIMSATKFAREPAPHLILQGKKGTYLQSHIDNQEALLLQGVQPQGDWNRLPETHWGILHTERQGEVIRQAYEPERGNYQTYYDKLYQALQHQTPLPVTAQQAYQVLTLIEQIYRSAACGQKLPVTGI